MAESGSDSRVLSHSKELLNVGNKPPALDTLLVTRPRSKPERLPPSSVLSRVKSFLPQLEESNRVLQERLASEPAENLDIEHLVDYDGPVIEMNIGIRELEGSSSDSEPSSSSEEEDDSSSDDEGKLASGLLDEVSADNIKLPHPGTGGGKRKRKPVIEELPVNKEDVDMEESSTPVLMDR